MDLSFRLTDRTHRLMQKNSIVKELIDRRVLQIIGLYIAATWMMIEIGDWMTDRFSTPQSVTSYIFIGMILFLPSVAILSYQYGRPGKDSWKKTTFVFVPSNLLIACFAMFYLVSPVDATETKIVVDEKGVQKSFEVARKEYRNNLVSYFWKNKSGKAELDWMQYGLAWLLSKDLDRSLFISAYTPFSSRTILTSLKSAGFERAIDAPKSLQLEMARKRFLKYVLEGQFDFADGVYTLNVDIYDVQSGNLKASHSVSGEDLLPMIDDLTINIKESLDIPVDLNEQSKDLPISQHTSESLKAIKDIINAKISRTLDNDFQAAKALAEESIKKDFSFANAYTDLAGTNQLMGNTKEASEALSKAFKHEYKLTAEEKFLYRGLAYGFRGDYSSQVKIYDMWIELFPEDIDAYQIMARILLVTGIDHDKALFCLKQLRLLNPSDDSVLGDMTELFVLRNELDKAVETQKQYSDLAPHDSARLIDLASIYERTSQFERAKETYNRVLLLDMNNYSAAIKLALLELKLGNFQESENRLATLLANANSERQLYDVLKGYLLFYSTTGQLGKVLKSIDRMKENAQHLPPILQIFELDFSRTIYQANLGQFKQALVALGVVKSKLQPPLDSMTEIGALAAHILAEDQHKATESIAQLELYVKQFPNPMVASAIDSSKGSLKELENDYESAVIFHKKALDVTSGTVVNTQNEATILGQRVQLANARRASGNIQQAKKDLVEVLVLFPSMPSAHFALAKCFLAENDMASFYSSMEKTEEAWSNADEDYIEYKKFIEFKSRIVKD